MYATIWCTNFQPSSCYKKVASLSWKHCSKYDDSFPDAFVPQIHAVEALLSCSDDAGMCPTLVWSNGTSESFISQPPGLAWQKIRLQNVTKYVCVS